MENELYEVSRDEYAGLVKQLKKDCVELEEYAYKDMLFLKLKSKKTGKHLTTRIVPDEGEEKYYVFNLPDDNERTAAPRIRQIHLETPEEVQVFFDILKQINKEGESNGRTIS